MQVEHGPPAPGGVQQLIAMGDTGDPGLVTIARHPPGIVTIRTVGKYGALAWSVGALLGMSRVASLGRLAMLGALGAYYVAREAQASGARAE